MQWTGTVMVHLQETILLSDEIRCSRRFYPRLLRFGYTEQGISMYSRMRVNHFRLLVVRKYLLSLHEEVARCLALADLD